MDGLIINVDVMCGTCMCRRCPCLACLETIMQSFARVPRMKAFAERPLRFKPGWPRRHDLAGLAWILVLLARGSLLNPTYGALKRDLIGRVYFPKVALILTPNGELHAVTCRSMPSGIAQDLSVGKNLSPFIFAQVFPDHAFL